VVGPGTVLGVVEVMKCFNQIAYGGDDVPLKGIVTQILAADASEVGFNQVIMLVKPA
jgi:biotin carboxyl carrier protein